MESQLPLPIDHCPECKLPTGEEPIEQCMICAKCHTRMHGFIVCPHCSWDTSSPGLSDIRYTHDCKTCVFLGQFEEYDLYFCPQIRELPTVLARNGNNGPDYMSGLALAEAIPALGEAKRRAIARGLLKE